MTGTSRTNEVLSPLLMTKLSFPPVRPGLVHRPRLIERLNYGLYGKLTLVSAPAGFGKTTLVSEWLSAQERPVAWLSLDETDNDPVQFLIYLTAALNHMEVHDLPTEKYASIGQSVRSLLHSPQPPPITSLVALLINDLVRLDLPLILVLDDYQLISVENVHHILQTLLARQPPTMHTVVCTRQDLPVSLPRLRARGQVTEIREPDLRFTEFEAADFMERTMGLHVGPDVVQALEGRTEGWIAGLQLAALALQRHQGDAQAFVASFTGDDRYIMDYMLAEVLQQQPQPVREFVQQTAILDRFTASLCDAVTGRTDSQAVLERLEAANLFLVPLDHRREWYRYHRLFAEFLKSRLDVETRKRLHRRAMRAYQAALEVPGYMQQAIGHALAYAALFEEQPRQNAGADSQGHRDGAQWADAERLIGLAAEETLHAGGVLTLRRWMEALPDERVWANSELSVYQGWALALTGEMSLAQEYADAAQEGLQDVPVDRALQMVRGRLFVLQSWLAVLFHQDYDRALKLSAGALEQLGTDQSHWRVLALWAKAESQERTQSIIEAITTLREALAIGRILGNQVFVATVEISLALALNQWGKRREAVVVCQEALERYTDDTGHLSPIAGLVLSRLAMLHYEANEIELARACHDRGMALSEQVSSEYNLAFFEGLAAPILYAQGKVEQALTAVQQGYQTAMQTGLVDAEWFLTREAGIRLQEGDLAFVVQWAEGAGLSGVDELEYLRIEQHLLYARLLLARMQYSEARRWLARLEGFTREHSLYRWLLTVHLLQALAADVLGERELVRDRISRAIKISAPQDYVRAWLDESPRLLVLLSDLRHIAPEFVDRLNEHKRIGSDPAQQKKERLIEPLSPRELEVLCLIAAGLSNREIAEELYIAVGTVKRHINHIYGKLGVHSRTQALVRARELDVL